MVAVGQSFFQDGHGFTLTVHSTHSCTSPEKALDECGPEVTSRGSLLAWWPRDLGLHI